MTDKTVIEEISETITVEDETTQVLLEDGTIEIIEVAEQGPAGRPGPPGSSSDVILDGYTHTQVSPASTWTINHNLGRRPIVTLLTTGAVEFEGQLTHVSDNQAVVNLATAVAGTARCL